MEPLTRRQQEILEHIQKCAKEGVPALSLVELCDHFELKSRGSMHKQVHALIDAGYVLPMNNKRRGVHLADDYANLTEETLPLMGAIAAGQPIEAIQIPSRISVPAFLRSEKPCYVLKVQGDSMIDEGIFDGDWVIIEQRQYAQDNEIVVALTNGQDATLKRIEQTASEIILHPANKNMKPLYFKPEEIEIQGILVGQMRSYQ